MDEVRNNIAHLRANLYSAFERMANSHQKAIAALMEAKPSHPPAPFKAKKSVFRNPKQN